MAEVHTGLDLAGQGALNGIKGSRIGLLANQASCDGRLNHARDVLSGLFAQDLCALFGPQHGYGGEDQDNMIETPHARDKRFGIPVFSLYSETREPLPSMLELIDILVIDLQDVGTRVYTFASTMLGCLKACARQDKRVIILDRPNPLGGTMVEGNVLEQDMFSFVGPFALPMRHGLTMGEMARMFNTEMDIGCELDVISMKGWKRDMSWNDTGLRWLMPSTNMPTADTAAVYPGQVIWEGTNLSEGRGTCRPFEIFGAPWLDAAGIKKFLENCKGGGYFLQEFKFKPTFHKWKGEICNGFMIHILDRTEYRPYFTAITLLKAIIDMHSDKFQWRRPPYEYEYEREPIDLIIGSTSLRKDIESGPSIQSIEDRISAEAEAFVSRRRPYLLY